MTISDLWAAFEAFHDAYFIATNGEAPSIELWAKVGGCVHDIAGNVLFEFDTFDEAVEWLKEMVQDG